jgi:hypothetical protein
VPDIPERFQFEADVQAALEKCRGRQRRELIRVLNTRALADDVPNEFWTRAIDCERSAWLLLLPIFALGAARLGRDLGVDVSRDAANVLAGQYVRNRAAALARAAVDGSRSAVAAILDRLRDDGKRTRADLDEALDVPFGRARAEGAAITETTAANSAGERRVVSAIRDTGADVDGVWKTERDTKVCRVCRNLQGKGEDVWTVPFPEGPPAHPRCRCWVDYGSGVKFRSGIPRLRSIIGPP